MKFLFISENYFPNVSGVPVVVKYLAERLVEMKYDVGVLTRNVEGTSSEEILNGVTIYRKNVYYDILKNYKGDKERFVEFIRFYNADINIFEGGSVITTDIVLPYLKSIDGIKILHSHGFSRLLLKPFEKMSTLKNTLGNTYNFFRWKNYFRNFLPQYINDFDIVFCLSEIDSSYDYLTKIYNKNVNIIGNSADDMFFSKCDSNLIDKYVKLKNPSYFLSVANYAAVKNQIGIMEQYFKSGILDHDIVFIGRDKNYYYDALVKQFNIFQEKYGKRNVHFLLNVDRNDIPSIVEGAKLYLVGSTAEGYSISIIESMSKGVPFISTNVGNASLLPGGIVIDNIQDMHKKIAELLSDKDLYDKLSENGKNYAYTECRIQSSTNKLLKLIAESKEGVKNDIC